MPVPCPTGTRTPTPTATGTQTATSSSITNGGNFSIALRGTGVGGQIVANPTGVDFGPVGVGQTFTKTITLRNVGSAPVATFAGGGVGAPFNVTQDCVIAGGLLPGKACHYYIPFSPTAAGEFNATSSSFTDGGSFSITMHGSADAGIAVANPTGIDFGSVLVGQSVTRTINIFNAGRGPITGWAGGGLGAPFNVTQDCVTATGLARHNTCHYFVTFTPTAAGPFSATSSSVTSGGPFSIAVQGTGVAPVIG